MIRDRQPVTFLNRNGVRLFGILDAPSSKARRDLAVLILSPGVKMRVGPQRLYVSLADLCLSMGLPVLRFDFHGLGDSEGALPEEQLRDVYHKTETGRFVDDTIDAMNWMEKRHGFRRFLLAGLCGGAVTGLLAAEKDSRVIGLLAIGITPVLSARSPDAARYMTVGQMEASEQVYRTRLLNPKAWFRLLTLQADYLLMARMVSRRLRGMINPARPPIAQAGTADNANPMFPSAFFAMLSARRPLLLMFGGADRLHWEYQEKFVERHRDTLARLPSSPEVHLIEAANHVLSFTEWQDEMARFAAQWLRSNFASDLVDANPAPS